MLQQKTGNESVETLNDVSQCGANDCPWLNKNNTNLQDPEDKVVNISIDTRSRNEHYLTNISAANAHY